MNEGLWFLIALYVLIGIIAQGIQISKWSDREMMPTNWFEFAVSLFPWLIFWPVVLIVVAWFWITDAMSGVQEAARDIRGKRYK